MANFCWNATLFKSRWNESIYMNWIELTWRMENTMRYKIQNNTYVTYLSWCQCPIADCHNDVSSILISAISSVEHVEHVEHGILQQENIILVIISSSSLSCLLLLRRMGKVVSTMTAEPVNWLLFKKTHESLPKIVGNLCDPSNFLPLKWIDLH